ncbi:MAG: RNA polymerase sigma factor [Pseudomonadota bacterium]
MSEVVSRLAVLFREHHGRLLAQLLRHAGTARLAACEDALQQAMVAALRHWPFDGVPENPAAWLFEAARRALIDEHRWASRRETGHALDDLPAAPSPDNRERFARELDDDELALLFAVCHPALPPVAQVALALRTLGGLGVRELAAGLLLTEAALAKRLERARERLAALGEPLAVPSPDALPARRDAVLTALYVMFNEGYQSAQGSSYARRELCFQALRLVCALAAHPVAGAPEADVLAALMCLHAARLSGRVDADGTPLRLPEQPRERWDAGLVALGHRHLARAGRGDRLTRWHCEAASAAAHAAAPSYAATDWATIVGWYERLLALDPAPVPRLAHAIALGEARGAAEGLAAVEATLPLLPRERYPFGEAARAEFLHRVGREGEALEAWRAARAQARSDAERALIDARIAALGPDP